MPARGSFSNNKKGKFAKNFNKRKHTSKPFNNPKSKQNFKRRKPNDNDDKKRQNEIVPQEQDKNVSSSDSENEIGEDPLKQLLDTFETSKSTKNKRVTAIDTDSESAESESESKNDSQDAESEDVDDLNDVESDDYSDIESEVKVNFEDVESAEFNDNDTNKDSDGLSDEIDTNDEPESEILKVDNLTINDPFVKHLCYDLSENFVETLQNVPIKRTNTNIEWPWLGKLSLSIPRCENSKDKITTTTATLEENKIYAAEGTTPTRLIPKHLNLNDLHVKSQIHNNIKEANICLDEDDVGILTEFQSELFSIVNNYQDLYLSDRTFENADEIRFVYCLHAINHVLKTRTKVLHHNARLQKKDDVPEEFRDQGLVRPKVLIIVPFRDSALKIVQTLIDLLVPNEAGQVINKNRFVEDFTGNELVLPKKNPKPEDYELTFTGNCDDTFKIGIQVTKKSLKLYADFYSSDIIIASPLGLRLTVGAAGEAERDHDFLASIELLIMDQTELFLMQNWDHLVHVLDHLHVQPKQAHGTDFARVRTWSLNGFSRYYRLNGFSRYYRQSLIFSSSQLPEINAIFNRKCCNYAGCVRTVNPITNGSIVNVHVQVPQIYKRFGAEDACKAIDARFQFFLAKILPQFRDTIMKQSIIYVPSYFDYVKIRNHFKREDIGFVQICEYSKDAKIARARDMFFHGDAHFLLYSERFHYFRRIRLKGIRHVIFYQPPTFPHFYSEICNFMQEANQNKKCGNQSNMTVTVIYSKYDYQRMAPILGTERLAKVATSNNNFHMFTSSDR